MFSEKNFRKIRVLCVFDCDGLKWGLVLYHTPLWKKLSEWVAKCNFLCVIGISFRIPNIWLGEGDDGWHDVKVELTEMWCKSSKFQYIKNAIDLLTMARVIFFQEI